MVRFSGGFRRSAAVAELSRVRKVDATPWTLTRSATDGLSADDSSTANAAGTSGRTFEAGRAWWPLQGGAEGGTWLSNQKVNICIRNANRQQRTGDFVQGMTRLRLTVERVGNQVTPH